MHTVKDERGATPNYIITEMDGQFVLKHQPTGATYSLSDPTSHVELRNAIQKLKKLINSVEDNQ